ncbi:hypothetical protein WJX72_004026 [[Myrmecia] bisecta]|uniref:Uncharacterized protein n=1 Tax=[Myrmecia] bisecta TaxID=41462 RepID=A0AAW1QBS4_9CHLO
MYRGVTNTCPTCHENATLCNFVSGLVSTRSTLEKLPRDTVRKLRENRVIKIYSAAWFLALTSALVACVGFIIGQAANMPVGMGKLVAVAYIVEIFNASASNLVLGATARSVGIQLGVLCHLLVCSFVVPQPSSDKALQSLRSGLVSIKNMNKIAWNKRLWRRLAGLEEGKGGGGMGQAASTDSMAGAPATAVAQRSSVPASTDVPPAALSSDDAELLQALAHLAAFRQHMRDAANEAYVGSWCCSLRVYLPVLRGVLPERARHLPGPQLTELERCCLDATRTLWTLMLAVNKGIDEELEEVLAARYTPALVRELRSSSDAAFQDAIDAFVLDAPVVQGYLALAGRVGHLLYKEQRPCWQLSMIPNPTKLDHE